MYAPTTFSPRNLGVTALAAMALIAGSISGAEATDAGASLPTSTFVPVAAGAKAKGRQVRIKVTGQRFGKKAKITLKGYRGKAKGVERTVWVKKTKTVKRLKPGKYKVTAKRITWNGAVAKAKRIKPKRVTVTRQRGATSRITYRTVRPAAEFISGGVRDVSDDGKRALIVEANNGRSRERLSVVAVLDGRTLWSIDVPQTPEFSTGPGADLSPDGNKVAFWSGTPPIPNHTRNPSGHLYVKNLDTGSIRRVDTGPWGTSGYGQTAGYASFSPDSSELTFKANSYEYHSYRLLDQNVQLLGTGDKCQSRVAHTPDGSGWVFQTGHDEVEFLARDGQIHRTFDISWAFVPLLQGVTSDGRWALITHEKYAVSSPADWTRIDLKTGSPDRLLKQASAVAFNGSQLTQLFSANRKRPGRVRSVQIDSREVTEHTLTGSPTLLEPLYGNGRWTGPYYSSGWKKLTENGRYLLSYDGSKGGGRLVAINTKDGEVRMLASRVETAHLHKNVVVYYKTGHPKMAHL